MSVENRYRPAVVPVDTELFRLREELAILEKAENMRMAVLHWPSVLGSLTSHIRYQEFLRRNLVHPGFLEGQGDDRSGAAIPPTSYAPLTGKCLRDVFDVASF